MHRRGRFLPVIGWWNCVSPSSKKRTMEELLEQISKRHLGDAASIIGLLVALIGFSFTLFGVWRSKKAAEMAQEEVRSVKQAIARSSTIADFSAAVTTMNEIKRLHRAEAWVILPDRYAALRNMLISIRSTNPDLQVEYRTAIQSALQQFSAIEKTVERSLASNKPPTNRAKLNEIVSVQVDRLIEILEEIKRDIGV
jgi:hypothetical protein